MIKLFQQATKQHASEVRAIAKKHGIKRCRILGNSVFIGTQLEVIEKETALILISDLKAAGYENDIPSIINMLIEKNDLCGLAVQKVKKYGA